MEKAIEPRWKDHCAKRKAGIHAIPYAETRIKDAAHQRRNVRFFTKNQ